jgi:hypothetical protein
MPSSVPSTFVPLDQSVNETGSSSDVRLRAALVARAAIYRPHESEEERLRRTVCRRIGHA